MGLWQKIKSNFLVDSDIDYTKEYDMTDESYEDYPEVQEEEPVEETTDKGTKKTGETGENTSIMTSNGNYNGSKITDISMAKNAKNMKNRNGFQNPVIRGITPDCRESGKEIALALKANCQIVLHLQGLSWDLRNSILDYTAGACEIVGGSMRAVSDDTFIVFPAGCILDGDLIDETAGGDGLSQYYNGGYNTYNNDYYYNNYNNEYDDANEDMDMPNTYASNL